MVIGASTEGPVIFALAIFDRQVVDAGDPPSHQALFVELPILVAIAAKPVAGIVVPFICKSYAKRTAIRLSRNAQTSLISRYSSSRIHLRTRNASMDSRPRMNSARLCQMLSTE